MLEFKERTTQKITNPSKPISIGFKIFALGDFGSIYNWDYKRPGLAERVLTKKKQISVSILDFLLSVFFKSYLICYCSSNKMSFYIYRKRAFFLFVFR